MLNTSQPQATDFVQDFQNWWNSCPLFTRAIIFICSFISILGLFSGLPDLLVNQPDLTLGSFQITRLIFSPFTFFTIAEMLIGFLAYLPISAEYEKHWGTLKTICDFFLKNLEINLVFILLCYFLSIIYSGFTTFTCYGLWGIFFVHIAEKYLDNPEGVSMIFCLPFQVKNKFYPIVLFALFSVISNAIRLDILAGLIVGAIHFKFLNPYYEEFLNDRKVSTWEASTYVAWLRTLPYYVSVGAMGGVTIGASSNAYDASSVKSAGDYENPAFGGNANPNFGGNASPTVASGFKGYAQVEINETEDLSGDAEKQHGKDDLI